MARDNIIGGRLWDDGPSSQCEENDWSGAVNYFAFPSAAYRYARFRPYFHPIVMEKIRAFLNLQELVPCALDVGCGTGQSTVALLAIAAEVIGVESSQAMLDEALPSPSIRYLCAPAEHLPVPASAFNLVTVANALHWFDRSQFLAETSRVLLTSGWLVVYTNNFAGIMHENPEFARWTEDTYLKQYPTPPRNNQPLLPTDVRDYGLRSAGQESYTNEVTFSPDRLASYFMTQSNVIAAIEQGSEDADTVATWLREELTPLFTGSMGTFPFSGEIEYFQKE